jgi:hypothetical protein
MKKKENKKTQGKKLPLKHETIRRLDLKDEGDLKAAAGALSRQGSCQPSTTNSCEIG